MFKTIAILTFISIFLNPREQSCRISQNNVGQILQYGIDKRIFSSDCTKFSDTLSFSFAKNDCDIKEGNIIKLKNEKVAIYKQTQQNRSSLVFEQPHLDNDVYRVRFSFFCAGYETNGSLKITCSGDTLDILDINCVKSIE